MHPLRSSSAAGGMLAVSMLHARLSGCAVLASHGLQLHCQHGCLFGMHCTSWEVLHVPSDMWTLLSCASFLHNKCCPWYNMACCNTIVCIAITRLSPRFISTSHPVVQHVSLPIRCTVLAGTTIHYLLGLRSCTRMTCGVQA
jgi:hypothetical protein